MKTITVNGYSMNIYDDAPIGISLSGGADSALIFYMLMANTSQHIHVYSMFAPERREAMEPHVDAIVETVSALTGNTNYTYHKHPVDAQSPGSLFQMLTEKLDSNEVKVMYVGLTKFPPDEVYEQFEEKQPDWHIAFRNEHETRPLFGITIPITGETVDDRVYVPFVNLNKKDLASMYAALDIIETVFTKTRSCEDEHHIGSHCNDCWWCDERKWAFGRLE